MRVVNYTNKLRENVIKMFKPYLEQKDKEAAEIFFDDFKENNNNYKCYIEAMFICNYLYANLTNNYEKDANTMMEMEYLESFNLIDEFADSLDYYDFENLCMDTYDFLNEDYYLKRDYIKLLKDKQEFLKSFCPLFIFDLLYYLNTFNTDEIKDNYYKNLFFSKDKKIAIEDTICIACDALNNINYNNVDNYKYIICELIEQFYKYYRYLLDNGVKLEEEVSFMISIIEENLNELIIMSYGNDVILSELIRGFLEYEVLHYDEKQKIDNYFNNENNKKKISEIKLKTLKIRGELI